MKTTALATALSRAFCGAVFVIHGWPKVLNFSATMQMFEAWGFPGWVGVPVGLFELFGGLLLVAGFRTRAVALIFVVEMAVALFWIHLPNGFFASSGGYEFVLALVVLLNVVLMLGPGSASVDAMLARPAVAPEPEHGPEATSFDEL